MVGPYQLKSYNFLGDSFEVFRLFQDEPFVFFLDSSLKGHPKGRFSFIGFDPFEIFQNKGSNSLKDLRAAFEKYFAYEQKKVKNIPVPFFSGIVGYFAYDFAFNLEKVKLKSQDDLYLPDCFFGFYDAVIAIDHLKNKLHVISTGLPERNFYLREKRAQYRLEKVIKKLSSYSAHQGAVIAGNRDGQNETELDFDCNFTKATYLNVVQKALEYIRQGDIYQVNLAQRFLFDARRHDVEIHAPELYQSLRRLSPSSFSGYLDCGHFQILSSSPEEFLHLRDGIAQTRPMKGTRPRGNNPKEDKKMKTGLLESQKDKAELLMITDLERNDLGRVCEYGSVKVKKMRTLEEYKTVFQTTSLIEGGLRSDKDCFDLMGASFPSGSVTGCPKIRAIEIIEELEPTRRAIYTGSLGYINSFGDINFNILIRTLLLKDEKIFFHAGSGIVSDSTPENEYNETLIKAKALKESLLSLPQMKKVGV